MDKLESVKELLGRINMPSKQQSTLCCLTLLAMANLRKETSWREATNEWIRIHDIISFIADNYGVIYAENSRETFRKQAMHPFRTAALITTEFLKVICSITDNFDFAHDNNDTLMQFIGKHRSLSDIYASKKKMQKMPVRINNEDYTFSPGKHNQLQKAILEEFAPRFAPHSECLYVGDTIKKDMIKNIEKLSSLGFEITLHDKMPDVVLYREDKNWIYFIESVTSVGPMDPKRILEIETMTKNIKAGRVYVTAFLDFATFKKFSDQLAWETEVWIADMPEHMIHLNGNKFLGPH